MILGKNKKKRLISQPNVLIFSCLFRLPNWKLYSTKQGNLLVSLSSTAMAACLRASLWRVTTNTHCTTWAGSLFTWRPLLPAEEAPVQGGVAAVTTLSLCVTRLTRRPALRFVPSLRIPTVTQKFPSMEKQEKPLKTGRWLVRSTTMHAVKRAAEEVRFHALLVTSLGSQTHIPITAFAVAGSKSKSVNRALWR